MDLLKPVASVIAAGDKISFEDDTPIYTPIADAIQRGETVKSLIDPGEAVVFFSIVAAANITLALVSFIDLRRYARVGVLPLHLRSRPPSVCGH